MRHDFAHPPLVNDLVGGTHPHVPHSRPLPFTVEEAAARYHGSAMWWGGGWSLPAMLTRREQEELILLGSDPELPPGDVLEIGCGTSEKGGFIKKIVEANNCRWVGIDIKETNLATHVCGVERMPFEDNSFDWVIGSQTLEHWKKPAKALREIRRVLRPAGMVSLTAPIHLHGEKMFVAGKLDSIEKLFLQNGFDIELCQKWRKEHCDLVPYRPNDYAKKHLKKAGILDYDNITTYIIHCLLRQNNKDNPGFWKRVFNR